VPSLRDAGFRRSLDTALTAGAFSQLPASGRSAFLSVGVRVDLPARTHWLAEDDTARPALIVDGLIRANIAAPDGRQLTVSYMRPGDIIGFFALFGGPFSTAVETVTDATLLAFPPDVTAALVLRDNANTKLFARVVTRRLYVVVEELTLHVFGTLRERVCHHLLDLAMGEDPEGPLVAHVTQQELAASTGAARESVARVLRALTQEGLIRRAAEGIRLIRPLQMHPDHERWREHRMPIT
jgi:CRP/FNR family cyclic AMP-dependent transcriptional regulator